MSRAYTKEECKEMLLERLLSIARFWANESRAETRLAVAEGIVFSILAEIDGESSELPMFALSPMPGKDDREYYEAQGENYWPAGVDLAGSLHDEFNRLRSLRS